MVKYSDLSDIQLIDRLKQAIKKAELMAFNSTQVRNRLEMDVCFLKSEAIRRNLEVK